MCGLELSQHTEIYGPDTGAGAGIEDSVKRFIPASGARVQPLVEGQEVEVMLQVCFTNRNDQYSGSIGIPSRY